MNSNNDLLLIVIKLVFIVQEILLQYSSNQWNLYNVFI